jgi:DAACS family dicarboxylate/amino acid:cation (Na+ or H+) symporter/aerobic C4-dicarboxylate transport protein
LRRSSSPAYTSSAGAQKAGGVVDFFMNIIPNTIVGAFATGKLLQIILFAVLFGIALARLGDRVRPFIDGVDMFLHGMFGIVRMVIFLAPIGAFGAIAFIPPPKL